MPLLPINDTMVFYRLTGPDDAPVLMLAHSLGQDHGMWDAQAADLSPHLRVLRYDIRGHGASGAPAGDYGINRLGEDALALADALGIRTFACCGLSLGGMIAQWLAVHAPGRVTAVVLANTSPRPGRDDRMEARRTKVLTGGMPAIADEVMSRFFSPQTLAAHPPAVAAAKRVLLATNPVGYAGCCAAIRDMDLTASLRDIPIPTLVIDGSHDVSLPWQEHGAVLAREIPGATAVRLAAAHLSNLERPRSFTAALAGFLLTPADASDVRERGLRVRRAVLGDAHVDAALAKASATSAAFQDLITRYAWGTIWSRPGLDVGTRRLLALAVTAALGRWEEFRLHVRTGLAHELEWCDLEETLLQLAIYAGVPAANSGLREAADERARGAEGGREWGVGSRA